MPTKKNPETETKSVEKTEVKTSKPGGGHKRAPLMPTTIFAETGTLGKWKLIDAAGQTLGRLSTQIAVMLMGKTNPGYTRHHDTGDSVIIINAAKIRLTGKKWDDKKYHYHTGYPGGIKEYTAKQLLSDHPEWLVEWAVHGMLPTGHMGRKWRRKLKVFTGPDHDHSAQQPETVKLPHTGQYFAE